jgi:signal transduction histidine kinase/ActR/RegA family two-component response regulator
VETTTSNQPNIRASTAAAAAAHPGARRAVTVATCGAIACGMSALIGWGTNTPRLTDWGNDGISMFPNTAACAILSGMGLLLNAHHPASRRLIPSLAVLLLLVAGLTLVEHATGVSLGIDTLIFHRTWGQTGAAAPMRMGLPASLAFLMLGAALLLLRFSRRGRGVAGALGVIVVALTMLSIIGYLYGAMAMYTIPRLTSIAPQSASAIFALGLALLFSVPDREPVRSLLQPGTAGMLARRALPVVVLLAVGLGWLRIFIQRRGLVDSEFGTALRTLTEIGLLSSLLWWAVRMVRTHESALVESEAALRVAKEAAEAANVAKDNFVATLSHELRTPLTPVLATLSAWQSTPDVPPALRADLLMVRRNIDLEARLIDDLLDLTRVVRGKFSLNLEQVDVHELVKSVVTLYRADLEAGRFQVSQTLQATDHVVRGDPGRLQQVFWNVLKNAVKFTPHGGRIDLSTRNDPDGRVIIAVRDSGLGISKDALARLFRPFEQGSDDIVKRYGGLGLGLTIARALLLTHGGEITAQSEGLGSGSTFTITLPGIDGQAHAGPAIASSPRRGARPADATGRCLRMLLVEDHADTARVLARLLGRNGHEVKVANSVRQALEALDGGGGSFEFLLSDLGLPDGSGIDVIRQMRQKLRLATPAIALSGFGTDDDIARCMAAGFNEHLTKPVNFQKLEAAIQRVAAAAAAGDDARSAS